MPSLIIHLAVAERYIELFPTNISNKSDFRKGSIAPDLNNNFSRILSKPEKAITHYYSNPKDLTTNFDLFKQNRKADLAKDYWKGYYAHLLTDFLFYSVFFKQEVNRSIKDNDNFYDDFTILTPKIVNDYHPKIDNDYNSDILKQCLATKTGTCKYLNYTKIHNFIEEMPTNLNQAFQDIPSNIFLRS